MNEVHVTPETASDETPHDLDWFCWCQPLAERQVNGGIVYIHRRTLDSPHIEYAALQSEATATGERDG